jgi:hypothetical protein
MKELHHTLLRFYWDLGTTGLTVVGALAFIGLATTRAVTGENGMDRPPRIAQLYGYTVCLVAIVTFLTSVNGLFKSLFTLSDPIAATAEPFSMGFEPSLSSFEAFRATYMFGTRGTVVSIDGQGAMPDTTGAVDTLTTTELRGRYEALRAERIQQVRHAGIREAVTSAALVTLAIVLFVVHWRWLRTRERMAAAPA